MRYERHASHVLATINQQFPAIAITGPRQSGKSTLARMAFPDLPFVNFESPVERASFADDPMGFLARFEGGAVFDEAQHVPSLFEHLQVRIDEDTRPGRWVLTGSQQFGLVKGIAESLAGRAFTLHLLPFSRCELTAAGVAPDGLDRSVFLGGYPPLYDTDRRADPVLWQDAYLADFVNRDIYSLVGVRDRAAFDLFLRACAALSGSIFEAAKVADRVGRDAKTISHWLSIMEACYLVRLVRPYHRNFGKRLSKRPKLYFLDTGLACRLLRVDGVEQLRSSPQYGALVETWMVAEAFKARLNRGRSPDLWFWRTNDGHEVDLVIETAGRLVPVEMKAAATPDASFTAGLRRLRELSADVDPGYVLYGGAEERPQGEDRFVPWTEVDAVVARCATP